MKVKIFQQNSHDHLLTIRELCQRKYGLGSITEECYHNDVIILSDRFIIGQSIETIKDIIENNAGTKKIVYFTEIWDNIRTTVNEYVAYDYQRDPKAKIWDKIKYLSENTIDTTITRSAYNPIASKTTMIFPEYLVYEDYDIKTMDEFRRVISNNKQIAPNRSSECIKMFGVLYNHRKNIVDNISRFVRVVDVPRKFYRKNIDKNIKFRHNHITVYPNYRFSASIENCPARGYVTEKALQPLLGNCIPIYYDPLDNITESIINPDAMIIMKSETDAIDVNRDFSNIHIFKEDALQRYDLLIQRVYDVI